MKILKRIESKIIALEEQLVSVLMHLERIERIISANLASDSRPKTLVDTDRARVYMKIDNFDLTTGDEPLPVFFYEGKEIDMSNVQSIDILWQREEGVDINMKRKVY